ncbi:hypothetical protein DESC_710109 [Desulfosarcina cetonica]|nr:hypothetical protein DESC_710109 [Desulfosarcina cetonica]
MSIGAFGEFFGSIGTAQNEQVAGHHHGGADHHADRHPLVPHQPPHQRGPKDRRIGVRRQKRRLGVAVRGGFGQLLDDGENTDAGHPGQHAAGRQVAGNQGMGGRDDHAAQDEIEHRGQGIFRFSEVAQGHVHQGDTQGRPQPHDGGPIVQNPHGGARDQENAAESEKHGHPTGPIHPFPEQHRRQGRDEQGRGEKQRRGIGHGQQGIGPEHQPHADIADDRTIQVGARPPGLEHADRMVGQHVGHQQEKGHHAPVEHHLHRTVADTARLGAGVHQNDAQRRQQNEEDALGRRAIHETSAQRRMPR